MLKNIDHRLIPNNQHRRDKKGELAANIIICLTRLSSSLYYFNNLIIMKRWNLFPLAGHSALRVLADCIEHFSDRLDIMGRGTINLANKTS